MTATTLGGPLADPLRDAGVIDTRAVFPTVGQAATMDLAGIATGGLAPYAYASTVGVVTGSSLAYTPGSDATAITITVTDARGATLAIPVTARRGTTVFMRVGRWGGVDLVELTSLSGGVSFSVVAGSPPAGLALTHAKIGQILGAPAAAGTTAVTCRAAVGGATQDVRVVFAVAAAVGGESATPRAFPGAFGFGRFAAPTYAVVTDVTTLADDGPGSLRAALALGGYVRVLVEGEIYSPSELRATVAGTTIDGRLAPGLGNWITGSRLSLQADDLVVRGMRLYAGSRRIGQQYGARDSLAIGVYNADPAVAGRAVSRVYVDGCDMAHAVDETAAIWSAPINTLLGDNAGQVTDVTIARSVIGEHFNFPLHLDDFSKPGTETGHPDPFLLGDANQRITVWGVVMLDGESRNPQIKPACPAVELVNCVVANFGPNGTQVGGRTVHTGGQDTRSFTNIIGNLYLGGPMTPNPPTRQAIVLTDLSSTDEEVVYLEDNLFGTRVAGAFVDGGLIDGVRRSGGAVGSGATSNGALFARSDVADVTIPASSVWATIPAAAGAKLRDTGDRHPLTKRMYQYLQASTPFQAADGWRGGSNPVTDEFAALGIAVVPGAGALTVSAPAQPTPAGRAVTGVRVEAIPLRGAELTTNGDLSAGATGWASVAGAFSVSGGVGALSGSAGRVDFSAPIAANTDYMLDVALTAASSDWTLRYLSSGGSVLASTPFLAADRLRSYPLRLSSAATRLSFLLGSGSPTLSIDGVSLRQVLPSGWSVAGGRKTATGATGANITVSGLPAGDALVRVVYLLEGGGEWAVESGLAWVVT